MRFRNKETGEIYNCWDDIICDGECRGCPVSNFNNELDIPCVDFADKNPHEAAEAIGYEVIDDNQTSKDLTIKCRFCGFEKQVSRNDTVDRTCPKCKYKEAMYLIEKEDHIGPSPSTVTASSDCLSSNQPTVTNSAGTIAENIKQVTKLISPIDILCQTAEECAELCQAILKIRRVWMNTTPVTEIKALESVNEEMADVLVCMDALIEIGVIDENEVQRVREKKSKRWKERAEAREQHN